MNDFERRTNEIFPKDEHFSHRHSISFLWKSPRLFSSKCSENSLREGKSELNDRSISIDSLRTDDRRGPERREEAVSMMHEVNREEFASIPSSAVEHSKRTNRWQRECSTTEFDRNESMKKSEEQRKNFIEGNAKVRRTDRKNRRLHLNRFRFQMMIKPLKNRISSSTKFSIWSSGRTRSDRPNRISFVFSLKFLRHGRWSDVRAKLERVILIDPPWQRTMNDRD